MTGFKLSSTRADLEREIAGAWIEYPDWLVVAFKVSNLHTSAYQLAKDTIAAHLAKKYAGHAVPQEETVRELGILYCANILRDWRGLVEDDGTEIPFSQERALAIMCDPAFREFHRAVEWCALEAGRIQHIERVVVDYVGRPAPYPALVRPS